MSHVFIVEDDSAMLKSLRVALSLEGFQVQCWHSAEEFLERIPNRSPAVIITDMRMPGMSGFELHQFINAAGKNIPIIYISGECSHREIVESMKLSPVDFLLKPFSLTDLLTATNAGLQLANDMNAKQARKLHFEQNIASLSPKERSVLQLMVLGKCNSEIMEILAISLPTAKQHKMQVMRKLGVEKLSQLIDFSKPYLTAESDFDVYS